MSDPTEIIIEARVDAAERPGMVFAGRWLRNCLIHAAGVQNWPVRVQFQSVDTEASASPPPSVIVTSLLPEVGRAIEPIDETETRWRIYLARLQANGTPVFVRNVFRCVHDRKPTGRAMPILERIRRLNRMAITLSHDLGAGVIDIDRDCAHIGGQFLQTDYRLGGILAAQVSGHAVVWSLLSIGLDGIVDLEVQEKAKRLLGDLNWFEAFLRHRLQNGQRVALNAPMPGAS